MFLYCFQCREEIWHLWMSGPRGFRWKCEVCGYVYDRLNFHKHKYWRWRENLDKRIEKLGYTEEEIEADIEEAIGAVRGGKEKWEE